MAVEAHLILSKPKEVARHLEYACWSSYLLAASA